MSMLKKLLFTALFVVVVFAVPLIIVLLTVGPENFTAIYITFFTILMACFGYIIVSVTSLSKEIKNAVDEMKMQNAAIAYKLTAEPEKKDENEVEEPEVENKPKNVNLNPADPLMIDGKPVSDSFDDFK